MPRKKVRSRITTSPFKRQLGIKGKENISRTLLNMIISSREGTTFRNPSKFGKKQIVVTNLLIRRAILTKNLRKTRGKTKRYSINYDRVFWKKKKERRKK